MDPILLTVLMTFSGGVIRAAAGWFWSYKRGDEFDLLDFSKSLFAAGVASVGTGALETNPWIALLTGAGAGTLVSKVWRSKSAKAR